MTLILGYLIAINSITFATTGCDKWLAIEQKWRVSEKTLLTLTLVGGTIGTGLAMLLFRHKTAKTSFLLAFFGILAVQSIALFFYVFDSHRI